MDSTRLVLLALTVGAVVGAAITVVFVWAIQARTQTRERTDPSVPRGIKAILKGLDDVAVVVDTSGTVRAGSPSAADFGMRRGTVLPDEQLRRLAREARDGAAAATAELSLRRTIPPTELRQVAARAVVATPRLVLVVARDVTESARLEQMRTDFVANTSHELKTPIGAISLLSEAIESAADDPEQVRSFAKRLTGEAARLTELTGRIMSLSRLQGSDQLTQIEVVSVDDVLSRAIAANTVQAQAAGVEIARGGDTGVQVSGDRQVLVDAVSNLISNAVAYSGEAKRVGVGVKREAGVVHISVTDHGIGIADIDQDRIFERFYRADGARSRRTGGSGLGLSIVRHAVERHGGEVRLWSRLGHGSTFTIILPVASTARATREHPGDRKGRG